MKRHKNWQEWGRKRAAQHQMNVLLAANVNAIYESLFEKDFAWQFAKKTNLQYRPFSSGSTMRIPIQFQGQSKQA